MQYISYYLVVITLVSFFTMGADKLRAKQRGARRVPEATLFSLAIVGGSIGILAGMYIFRHKTLHASFKFGIPLIILVQAVLLAYFL